MKDYQHDDGLHMRRAGIATTRKTIDESNWHHDAASGRTAATRRELLRSAIVQPSAVEHASTHRKHGHLNDDEMQDYCGLKQGANQQTLTDASCELLIDTSLLIPLLSSRHAQLRRSPHVYTLLTPLLHIHVIRSTSDASSSSILMNSVLECILDEIMRTAAALTIVFHFENRLCCLRCFSWLCLYLPGSFFLLINSTCTCRPYYSELCPLHFLAICLLRILTPLQLPL